MKTILLILLFYTTSFAQDFMLLMSASDFYSYVFVNVGATASEDQIIFSGASTRTKTTKALGDDRAAKRYMRWGEGDALTDSVSGYSKVLSTVTEDTFYVYSQSGFYIKKESGDTVWNAADLDTVWSVILAPYISSATPIVGGLIVNWANNSTVADSVYIDTCATLTGTYGNYSIMAASLGTDTLTGLTAYREYFVKMRANRSDRYSSYSNGSGGIPIAQSPSSLTATGADYKISLAWTANGNNNFVVHRSGSYNGDYTPLDTLTEVAYVDTPLTEDAIWYYKVLGYVNTNITGYTNIDSGLVTRPLFPPSAPTNFSATGKFKSITASWTDASNNETLFRIYAGADSASAAKIDSVSANVTSYCYTGLADSTIKYMYVQSVNVDGTAKSLSDSALTTYVIIDTTFTVDTSYGAASAEADFEENNFSDIDYVVKDGSNTVIVTSTGALDGTYSQRSDYEGTSDNDLAHTVLQAADEDTVWLKANIYLGAVCNDSVQYQTATLLVIEDTASTRRTLFYLGTRAAAGAGSPDRWMVGGRYLTTTTVATNFSTGAEHTIIMGWNNGAIGVGRGKIYIDGTSVADLTVSTALTNVADRIRIGLVSTANKWKANSYALFDNVVIAGDSLGLYGEATIDTNYTYINDQDSVACTPAETGTPLLTVAPSTYNYGIKDSADANYNASFIVTNDGTANATVTGYAGLSTPYSMAASQPTLPLTLQPLESAEFNTLFNVNRSAGTFNDTLKIYGSDTLSIPITGQVQVPGAPFEPPILGDLEDTMTVAKLDALCSGDIFILDKDHPSASDSNPGTSESAPLLTWNGALAKLGAGDGLLIKKSTSPYIPASTQTNISASGNATTGGRIIIRGQYKNDMPVVDFSNTKSISSSGSYYTLECIYFYRLLQHSTTGTNVYFRGNKVYGAGSGNGQEAIRFRGSYGIAEYNEISNMGRNGINVYPANNQRIVGIIIRYNYIHDNTAHHGINIFPYTSGTGGSDCAPQYIDSVWMYGNRIENNMTGMYTRVMKNFKIFNNIFTNNTQGAILLEPDDDSNLACVPDTIQNGTYKANGVIMNNTIYRSHMPTSWQPAIENRACDSLFIINNVIWESNNSSNNVMRFYNPVKNETPGVPWNHDPTLYHTMDYNVIQQTADIAWGSGDITLSSWFNTTNQTHSIYPVSVNISTTGTNDSRWGVDGTYIPTVSSPVIDAGSLTLFEQYVGEGYKDYYGNDMGDDVGAVQYVP